MQVRSVVYQWGSFGAEGIRFAKYDINGNRARLRHRPIHTYQLHVDPESQHTAPHPVRHGRQRAIDDAQRQEPRSVISNDRGNDPNEG